MLKLLDSTSQRIIRILELLTFQEDWTSIKKMASEINVSERTIAGDIALIKKRWGHYLTIEASKKTGIRLQNRNVALMSNVTFDLFKDAIALKWIQSLLLFPNQNLEFYESQLYVSKSTLHRMLSKINDALALYSIRILHDGNRYEIVSDNESALRRFYASFLVELYGLELGHAETGMDFDFEVLKSIVFEVLADTQNSQTTAPIVCDSVSSAFFVTLLAVSLIRENQGYCIPSDYTEFKIAPLHWSYISTTFSNLSLKNIRPFYQEIAAHFVTWTSEAESQKVRGGIHEFCTCTLSKIYTAPSPEMHAELYGIIEGLYKITKSSPHKIAPLFDRLHYYSVLFERQNPQAHALVRENLSKLSQTVGIDMLRSLDYAIWWMTLNFQALTTYHQTQSILIISDFGKQHAEFLSRMISDFVNHSNAPAFRILAMDTSDGVTRICASDYDMIVTNDPTLPFQHSKMILINDYPTREDLFQICRSIV